MMETTETEKDMKKTYPTPTLNSIDVGGKVEFTITQSTPSIRIRLAHKHLSMFQLPTRKFESPVQKPKQLMDQTYQEKARQRYSCMI